MRRSACGRKWEEGAGEQGVRSAASGAERCATEGLLLEAVCLGNYVCDTVQLLEACQMLEIFTPRALE